MELLFWLFFTSLYFSCTLYFISFNSHPTRIVYIIFYSILISYYIINILTCLFSNYTLSYNYNLFISIVHFLAYSQYHYYMFLAIIIITFINLKKYPLRLSQLDIDLILVVYNFYFCEYIMDFCNIRKIIKGIIHLLVFRMYYKSGLMGKYSIFLIIITTFSHNLWVFQDEKDFFGVVLYLAKDVFPLYFVFDLTCYYLAWVFDFSKRGCQIFMNLQLGLMRNSEFGYVRIKEISQIDKISVLDILQIYLVTLGYWILLKLVPKPSYNYTDFVIYYGISKPTALVICLGKNAFNYKTYNLNNLAILASLILIRSI